ncbi:MAG: hypothetical protein LC721_09115 [Actinobacteria bacterium]|nr:hypothetical protein [Actinomycetota bacterium]
MSLVASGCPGIFGSNLFVEQLLPGLDPVAHGHVGSSRSGLWEIDLVSRGPYNGRRAMSAAAGDLGSGPESVRVEPMGNIVVDDAIEYHHASAGSANE